MHAQIPTTPHIRLIHPPQTILLQSVRLRGLPGRQWPIVLSRSISLGARAGIKKTAWNLLKWTGIFWLAIVSWSSLQFGIDDVVRERDRPTPPDWSQWTRFSMRLAQSEQDPKTSENGIVDWARVGSNYQKILARLEDPKIDGAGLESQLGGGGDIYVLGVGKTGYDISGMPEPWRRGYHQVLMGCAHAAEHLNGWVRDKGRHAVFPPEVVVGPSNPKPKRLPHTNIAPPREEDCEPAYESPHRYYLKLLTTKGFSTRQRLDAALSYADWLRFKGLTESAHDVHAWALDIAEAGMLPLPSSIDRRTGILKAGATNISSNLLLAAIALGTHHAQTGDLAAAMPIFLSVLRAQQALPPPDPATAQRPRPPQENKIARTVKTLVSPTYPPPPPTGDEPATRTPAAVCAEAATMAHVGEVLFAATPLPSPSDASAAPSSHAWWWPWTTATPPSSALAEPQPAHAKALAWTRDAVDLAAATLRAAPRVPASPAAAMELGFRGGSLGPTPATPAPGGALRPEDEEARKRCAECLAAGMRNWSAMVGRLAEWEVEVRKTQLVAEGKTDAEARVLRLFLERGENGERKVGRWQNEVDRVERRGREVSTMLREEGLKDYM